jgi:hypothetical protein
MVNVALAGINSFASGSGQNSLAPPEEDIIEIPISQMQGFFDELIVTYNALNDLLKESSILRGRELAELNENAMRAIKSEKSPIMKLLYLNTYIRKQINRIDKALKAGSPAATTDQRTIRQAISKIQLRAMSIVEHVKTIAEGKKEIAFNSGQARQFLAGREGQEPSRRDTIRALRRAERICPALNCGHTPYDGRATIRLTAKTQDLKSAEIKNESIDRIPWQRSKLEELKIVFFKETGDYA